MDPRALLPSVEWDDPDRVRALFTPSRPRDLNPEAHDAKRDFLARMVEAHSEHTGNVTVTLDQLEKDLTFQGIKPEGLDVVMG